MTKIEELTVEEFELSLKDLIAESEDLPDDYISIREMLNMVYREFTKLSILRRQEQNGKLISG